MVENETSPERWSGEVCYRCTRFIQLPQRSPILAERIPKTEAIKQAVAQFLMPFVIAQSVNL